MKRPSAARRTWLLLPILPAIVAMVAVSCGNGDGGAFSFASESVGQASQQSGRAGVPTADFAQSDGDFGFDDGFGFAEAADQAAFAEEQPVAVSVDSATGGALPNTGPGDTALQTVERRVIQNASLTIQVEDVRAAAESVRDVAIGLGGFVEQLSVSGDGDFASGFVVIRVPQEEFFTAQDRLSVLGKVLDESISAQDVTEQFVDLEAQLRSLTAEEARLIQLLEQADSVSEILIVESELTRIRTRIERLQGQLNFLERRVALATISVSLFPPRAIFTEPPSASLTLEVKRVQEAQDAVKDLTEQLDGVVDSATLRVVEGEESATIQIRVDRDDFESAVLAVETLGDVRQKSLSEGGGERFPGAESVVIVDPEEPDARIDVRLFKGDDDDTVLIASLAGSLGGVALLLVIGFAIWAIRRRGAAGGGGGVAAA